MKTHLLLVTFLKIRIPNKFFSLVLNDKEISMCIKSLPRWNYIPMSPAFNCKACMQGVTPSNTYILLLLLGQNLNWNVHSFPFTSFICKGRPSDCEIGGK